MAGELSSLGLHEGSPISWVAATSFKARNFLLLAFRSGSSCAAHIHQHHHHHSEHNQLVLLSKAKRKSLEMTATVSIIFAICWLPYSVTTLLLVTVPDKGKSVCQRERKKPLFVPPAD